MVDFFDQEARERGIRSCSSRRLRASELLLIIDARLCRKPGAGKGEVDVRGTYPGHHSSCCNVSREDSQKEYCAKRKADTHFIE